MINNIENRFTKNCPICNDIIIYKNKIALNQSIRLNCSCKLCQYKNNKEKISNTLKNKYATGEIIPNMTGAHSFESRQKISKSNKGKKQSIDSRKKRSISCT